MQKPATLNTIIENVDKVARCICNVLIQNCRISSISAILVNKNLRKHSNTAYTNF